ncbi:MAG: metal ABC transporter permease [Spirochaetales bacterium]|nr:metal ABC transporter permease [Spirochaetales bacterium]
MTKLIAALFDAGFPFLRNALLAGLLSSAAFGIVGSFVVVNKISYIAGAISHSVLSGIGFALFCRHYFGWTWFHPLLGAFLASLLAAFIIGWAKLHTGQREDSIIGAIWAVGMATGLVFIYITPGYTDPMSYLFGDILLVESRDLLFILVLDIFVVVLAVVFYNHLQAVSFDSDFVALKGLKSSLYYFLLLFMTAATVVLMTTIVGIVMVIALLTLPAAINSMFFRRLSRIIIGTVLSTIIFTVAGISVSYPLNMPSGPVIIMIAGIVYLLAFIPSKIRRKK